VLSRGGKRLVVLFIVLGVLYFAGVIIAATTLGGSQSRIADVQDARVTLDDAVRQFQDQSATCQRQADLACQQAADRDLATAFHNFNDDLSVIDFSRSQLGAATDCEVAASQMAAFLDDQSAATTPRPVGGQARFEQLGNNFDQAYRRLIDSL
jgi:hypothetical protein